MAETSVKKFLDHDGLTHIIEKLYARGFKGMGLSHEDFTAELKAKLNSTATTEGIAQLERRMTGLETVINSDGTADGDSVINKLNEVFAFLADVSSDQKLKALLAGKMDATAVTLADGVITINGESITPLTEHQSLAAYALKSYVDGELAKKVNASAAITNAEIDAIISA